MDFLKRKDLLLVWFICGAKEIIQANHSSEFIGQLSISGEYLLNGAEIEGAIRCSPQIGRFDA